MIIRLGRFNIYLLVAVLLVLTFGCRSDESWRKKQPTVLRLHAEAKTDPGGHTEKIEVFRAQPYWVTIEKQPFVTEINVKSAQLANVPGGYSIEIQFDRKGTWTMEQYTSALRGKHIAVFCQWAETSPQRISIGRWLAAPLISNRVSDGLFIFTPDSSREEAEQIVVGLNNVAKENHRPNEPGD